MKILNNSVKTLKHHQFPGANGKATQNNVSDGHFN